MQQRHDFLAQLETEASLQAKLSSSHMLPKQLDAVTTFVGNYPWQVVLVLSGVTALVLALMGNV